MRPTPVMIPVNIRPFSQGFAFRRSHWRERLTVKAPFFAERARMRSCHVDVPVGLRLRWRPGQAGACQQIRLKWQENQRFS